MSSTSSLEVHKSDSSVIEETEGVVVNSSDRLVDSKTLVRASESVSMEITVRQDFSLANSDMGTENTSGNDGPFEMTSIRCEISNILQWRLFLFFIVRYSSYFVSLISIVLLSKIFLVNQHLVFSLDVRLNKNILSLRQTKSIAYLYTLSIHYEENWWLRSNNNWRINGI